MHEGALTTDITKGIEAVFFSLMTVAMVAKGELIRMTASVQPIRPMYCEASATGSSDARPSGQ